MLKRRIYESGHQVSSKEELWPAILQCARYIAHSEIRRLTNSMDQRLLSLIGKLGGYINEQFFCIDSMVEFR